MLSGRATDVLSASCAPRNDPPRTVPTVNSAIEQARMIRDSLVSAGDAYNALAERATRIATMLGGSFPQSATGVSQDAKDGTSGAISSVEAVNDAVERLKGPLNYLSSPHNQIAQALDHIERALG